MKHVTLDIPDEILDLTGIKDNIPHEALKLVVLELYREDVVSLGKAAELCGLSIDEFMRFSASRQAPVHYGVEELLQDRKQFKPPQS